MDREVPLTETAMFMCVGQGYGLVNVTWHRGGRYRGRLPPERSIVTTMITPDNIAVLTSILTIPDVTKEDHSTLYRCRYSNSQGETDSSIVRLTVGSKC